MTPTVCVNLNAEQAQNGDPGLPVFAIPHDDIRQGPLARMTPFANMKVIGARGMSPSSDLYKDLPDGMLFTYDNEDDNPDRSWRIPYLTAARAERPGIVWVCPPEKWFERNQYDNAEVALCDLVGIHIGVPEFLDPNDSSTLVPDGTSVNYPISLNGKPCVCLEVESDPAHPQQMAMIPEICRRLLAAGMLVAAAWGANLQYPDVLDHADIMAELRTLSQTTIPITEPIGGEPVAVDPSIQQVLDQNALIAQALYDVVKLADAAKPAGAPPSYDDLVQDAKTQVNALQPSKFVFP